MRLCQIFLFLAMTLSAVLASAKGGGGSSLGIGIAIASPSQDDVNSVISKINSTNSTSIDKLGSAYEFDGYWQTHSLLFADRIGIWPSCRLNEWTQRKSGMVRLCLWCHGRLGC